MNQRQNEVIGKIRREWERSGRIGGWAIHLMVDDVAGNELSLLERLQVEAYLVEHLGKAD